MKRNQHLAVTICSTLILNWAVAGQDVELPSGVKAVWDMDKAFRETTPTRERICINGLWRWQPAPPDSRKPEPGQALPAATPPTDKWGYFKVPGSWPGGHGQSAADTQRCYPHTGWKPNAQICWYQREIAIPAAW